MILAILTESNAFSFLLSVITLLGGGLVSIVIWHLVKLINKIEHLDGTMAMNNAYLKQHYHLLNDHEEKLNNHHDRIIKLEFSNGKAN
jgi:hypothetical protein